MSVCVCVCLFIIYYSLFFFYCTSFASGTLVNPLWVGWAAVCLGLRMGEGWWTQWKGRQTNKIVRREGPGRPWPSCVPNERKIPTFLLPTTRRSAFHISWSPCTTVWEAKFLMCTGMGHIGGPSYMGVPRQGSEGMSRSAPWAHTGQCAHYNVLCDGNQQSALKLPKSLQKVVWDGLWVLHKWMPSHCLGRRVVHGRACSSGPASSIHSCIVERNNTKGHYVSHKS